MSGISVLTVQPDEIKAADEVVWTERFTCTPDGYDNWVFFSVPQE